MVEMSGSALKLLSLRLKISRLARLVVPVSADKLFS